jgi:hypothetical protein
VRRGRVIDWFIQAGLVCCLLPTVAGCNVVNHVVGSSVSVGLPENQEAQEAEIYQRYFSPAKIDQCMALPRNSAQRQSCRDQITYARIRYIDIAYQQFRRQVFLEINGSNAAADITVLGLGAAGALVGTATTKAILAAISAGIVGAKSVISKDVLFNSAIQTLILKMDADRAAVRQHIVNNLQFNELAYPFEAAELDTGDYFRVVTINNALITLQGDAANADSASSKLINVPPATTPGWSPPAVLPPGPVETPTPLVPGPAPGATIPPVGPPPPPPPPPQTLPPPAPPSTRFTPPTPARSELFRALLSDDQGNRRFDPARRALMRQCWKELINPPPDNETTWLLTATDPTLRAVAGCINDKARREPATRTGPSSRQSNQPTTSSTAFTPPTPARTELFRALLSDDQGNRRFDPARRALMRQCWKELINPPPDNEAAWILTAPDPTLQAVADCINKKAGATR